MADIMQIQFPGKDGAPAGSPERSSLNPRFGILESGPVWSALSVLGARTPHPPDVDPRRAKPRRGLFRKGASPSPWTILSISPPSRLRSGSCR